MLLHGITEKVAIGFPVSVDAEKRSVEFIGDYVPILVLFFPDSSVDDGIEM